MNSRVLPYLADRHDRKSSPWGLAAAKPLRTGFLPPPRLLHGPDA